MTKPSRWTVRKNDDGTYGRGDMSLRDGWGPDEWTHCYYRRLCAYYISEARRWMRRSRGICAQCAWWSSVHSPADGLMGCSRRGNPLAMEYVEAPGDFGCNQWEAKR